MRDRSSFVAVHQLSFIKFWVLFEFWKRIWLLVCKLEGAEQVRTLEMPSWGLGLELRSYFEVTWNELNSNQLYRYVDWIVIWAWINWVTFVFLVSAKRMKVFQMWEPRWLHRLHYGLDYSKITLRSLLTFAVIDIQIRSVSYHSELSKRLSSFKAK